MPVIPVDYAQWNLRFEGLGVPLGAQITLGLEVVNSLTASENAELMWNIFVGENIIGFLSDQVQMVESKFKAGPSATGPEGIFVDSAVGGDTGDSDSPATAFLIHKNTNSGGRAGRGRWYLPGVAGSRVEPDGAVSSAVVTDLTAALADFRAGCLAEDLNPVVLHGEDSPLTIPTSITSFTVDAKVATQRRRLRR